MQCHSCGGLTKVVSVKRDKRRRKCLSCRAVFYTREIVIPSLPHGGDRKTTAYHAKRPLDVKPLTLHDLMKRLRAGKEPS